VSRRCLTAGLLVLLAGCAGTHGKFKGYEDAQARYHQARRLPGYDAFAAQFWKMNDQAKFDEKSGCYELGGGPVNLLLVLDKASAEGKPLKITIREAYTDVDTKKAKCFRKTYLGLATNIPPFLPILLQATLN
jgi:hypothetical protein